MGFFLFFLLKKESSKKSKESKKSSRKSSRSESRSAASSVSLPRIKSAKSSARAESTKSSKKGAARKSSSSDDTQSRKFNLSPDPRVHRDDESPNKIKEQSRSSMRSGGRSEEAKQTTSSSFRSARDKISAVEAVEMNQ